MVPPGRSVVMRTSKTVAGADGPAVLGFPLPGVVCVADGVGVVADGAGVVWEGLGPAADPPPEEQPARSSAAAENTTAARGSWRRPDMGSSLSGPRGESGPRLVSSVRRG